MVFGMVVNKSSATSCHILKTAEIADFFTHFLCFKIIFKVFIPCIYYVARLLVLNLVTLKLNLHVENSKILAI